MPKLIDYLQVNNDFSNAINLYLDLNKTEKLRGYIPTRSSVDILNQYLESIENNTQQATLLIGPYGKGKSHLLLEMLGILSLDRENQENKQVISEIVSRISNTDKNVAKRVQRIFESKGKFLPVIIMSTQGDLNQSFMVGLNDALKREGLIDLAPETYYSYALDTVKRWKEMFPETFALYCEALKNNGYTEKKMEKSLKQFEKEALNVFKVIYPELTSGSVFNPLINSEVLPAYKNIADLLREEYGYSGIYIIFDEFSKYIESQDKKGAGSNMKLLQDICELANSSKESQIFITMVAHKSIKEYGRYLSTDTINSFMGIEGRIKEIYFVTSTKNNYELIRNAIGSKRDCFKQEKHILRHIENGCESYSRLSVFSSFTRTDFEEIVVRGCYPLSPISAYLLLNVSEKVAQNERTLFTFISKDEQYSLLNIVRKMDNSSEWILNADAIYDYFKGLFKKDVTNEHIHSEWLNAEYALSIAKKVELRKVLKAIAIINIVNKSDEMPTTLEYLKFATGLSNIDEVIEELIHKDLIYKKGLDGTYVFKTRATSQIRTEIDKRKILKGERVHIGKVLESIAEDKFVLPKRYNQKYAMTRYFTCEYMDVKDFLDISIVDTVLDDGSFHDGKVLYLYNTSNKSFAGKIKKHLENNMPKELIVVYGEHTLDILDKVIEYDIVKELKSDTSFFKSEDNAVLLKEVPIIEEELETEIGNYLELAFSTQANKQVYFYNKGKLQSSKTKRITEVVDCVCAQVYDKSVYINNELINKEVVRTGAIKKVRKNLIECFLTHSDTSIYDKGTSADATIYRAVIKNTKIDTNTGDDNTKNVVKIIDSFFVNAGNKKCSMKELVNELTSAPIGMRKGVIPIIFADRLSRRTEEVVIYFGDKETVLTPDIVINMCEMPEDYSIYISLEDIKKQEYIANLCELYKVTDKAIYSDSKINSIMIAMQRWFRSLPQVTKNIKSQEEYFNNECISKAFPKIKMAMQTVDINPFEFIFEKMPKAFESDDFGDVVVKLSFLKERLNRYYDYVLDNTVEKTLEVFDKAGKDTLQHALTEWYEKQSDLAKNGLQSGKVVSLMNCISNITTFDDRVIVEKLVKAVTDMYIDSWNDTSLNKYIELLINVKEEAENMGNLVASENQLELTFVGKMGDKITKSYEHVPEGRGAILRNILADTLEDFGDLSVNDKIAILLEMIEKQL